MTSKERVMTAIALREPDRVPVIVNLSVPVAKKLNRYFGGNFSDEPIETLNTLISGRVSFNDLLCKLGNDCIGVAPTVLKENVTYHDDGCYTDEWGIKFSLINGYLEVTDRPLSHLEKPTDLDDYKIPDPTIEGRYGFAKDQIEKFGDDYAVMGCLGQTMFEMGWNLIGFEKFLIDLCLKEDYVILLLDKLTTYSIKSAKKLATLGCDIIFIGDDVGAQNGMLISDQLWREILKPRLAKICYEVKKDYPKMKIAYHSCGSIVPIISDLIEIGIDVLNPIQPLATGMSLDELKLKYGSNICFYGGIDVQKCIPTGTKEEIEEEVINSINSGAKGGGYIIAPAHIVPSETKMDNVISFFDAVKRNGKYNSI